MHWTAVFDPIEEIVQQELIDCLNIWNMKKIEEDLSTF